MVPELRQRFEQFTGSDAFELPYDLTDAVFGVEANEQVDVVLVVTHLLDGEFVPKLNLSQGMGYTCNGRFVEQSFTILHRKDKVVVRVVGAVIRFCDGHTDNSITEGNRMVPLRLPS